MMLFIINMWVILSNIITYNKPDKINKISKRMSKQQNSINLCLQAEYYYQDKDIRFFLGFLIKLKFGNQRQLTIVFKQALQQVAHLNLCCVYVIYRFIGMLIQICVNMFILYKLQIMSDSSLNIFGSSQVPQALFHGYTLTVGWVICQLIAIWALLLRNRSKMAIYIHGIAMTCLLVLGAMGTVQLIFYKGVPVIAKTIYHTLLGFVIVCLTPIVCLLGAYVTYKEGSPSTNPLILQKIKLSHIIPGWVLIALSRVPLYNQWATKFPILCLILFFFDILSHGFYFYFKVSQVRMQSVSVYHGKIKPNSQTWLKQIKRQSDLQIYQGDYFIFADFVYKLNPLLGNHPGGFKIINHVRGRQVDRFLYGMQPLELFQKLARVSHTARSIELAGLPIAKIQDAHLYPKMNQFTSAKISGINFYQSSKRIYTIYLRPKQMNDLKTKAFSYTGYRDISQLGKYYAVTISGTKTRLYTMVNFLQKKTIKITQLVTKGKIFNEKEKKILRSQSYGQGYHYKSIVNWEEAIQNQQNQIKNQQIMKQQAVMKSSNNMIKEQLMQQESTTTSGTRFKDNYIPLLIKKYDDGQFTPAFLSAGFNGEIIISKPRGRGLGLQDLIDYPKPYNIVMFSGGTGIYPFADTIDLLFKQLVMQTQQSLSGSIVKNDSILENKPFKDFNFSLYISVPTVEQIHPITLFQCEYLAANKRLKVFLKTHILQEKQIISKRYPNIQFSSQRYEHVLWHFNQDEISRIYVCGPTRMTKAIVGQLQRLCWSPRKYFVI